MRCKGLLLFVFNQAPLGLFAIVFIVFGSISASFLEPRNLVNILIQSSSIAVAATGMTFVLLTAGVDLSVGSVMFVAVAVSGKMIYGGQPLWLALAAGLGVGLVAGVINAVLVTRMKVIAFVATLAMLFVARGLGLWLTNTRAMNMPDEVLALGSSRWLGVPIPVIVMVLVAAISHWLLTRTPWGRQIYAIGEDIETARTAGIRVDAVLFSVYVVCGLCAALAGLVALSQSGAVSPSFGQQREFAAIAAAVLGGTSLFGGRGSVLPGTVLGAVLFQTVENGLVIINADPYLYPMILSGVIFVAVLLDASRARLVRNLTRRHIRPVD
jgi:ribose transport system permease protein